ncbi:IQ calmodulin-binding motif domain-containing protein [Cyclospora cayetanensis]|uniref:IQ calmodulin-binding motif domain-containing protein n=1 Tax=Cyclospora cayetanensis TaxID=88456 RepID=A0A1D3CWK9_9EIME|nr:IQ calmodulin-binding motif domain-containing protein [Cyclospora cayetanensis]
MILYRASDAPEVSLSEQQGSEWTPAAGSQSRGPPGEPAQPTRSVSFQPSVANRAVSLFNSNSFEADTFSDGLSSGNWRDGFREDVVAVTPAPFAPKRGEQQQQQHRVRMRRANFRVTSASPTRLLEQTPAGVEASLHRAVEICRRRISAAEAADGCEGGTSGRRRGSPSQSRTLTSCSGADKPDSQDQEKCSAGIRKERRGLAQGSAAGKVLLRLHSIQFCFDKPPHRPAEASELERTPAYCVTARYFMPAMQAKDAAEPTDEAAAGPSHTTAWFSASVYQEDKNQPSAPAVSTTASKEAAEQAGARAASTAPGEAGTRGAYFVEKCTFESDICLPVPSEEQLRLLNVNKIVLEVWRHHRKEGDDATAQNAQEGEAAAVPGVWLVGEAVLDLLEEGRSPKERCIVPINHRANCRGSSTGGSTVALMGAFIGQSGTLLATILKLPDKEGQQQKGNALDAQEKMWLYQDDNGKIQGPFSSTKMFRWISKRDEIRQEGYFEEGTPVFDSLQASTQLVLRDVAPLIAADNQRASRIASCPSTRETTLSDSGGNQSHNKGKKQSDIEDNLGEAGGPPANRVCALGQESLHAQPNHQHQEEPCEGQQQYSHPFESINSSLPSSASSWRYQELRPILRQPPEKHPEGSRSNVSCASQCLRSIKKHKMSSYLRCSIAAPSPHAAIRFSSPHQVQQAQQPQIPQQQLHPPLQPQWQQTHPEQQQKEVSLDRVYMRQRLQLLRETFGNAALFEACAVYIQAAFRGWRVRRRYALHSKRAFLPRGLWGQSQVAPMEQAAQCSSHGQKAIFWGSAAPGDL